MTGNVDIAAVIGNTKYSFEGDNSADIEHYRPCTLHGLETVAERLLAVVVEVGNVVDITANPELKRTGAGLQR